MIDRQFKLSDVDKIFGTLPMNSTISTMILTRQEMIYRNRQVCGTLGLALVRHKLYNQTINRNTWQLSLDKQNFHYVCMIVYTIL